MRKRHPSASKATVALEALRERKTMTELSSYFEIHRIQKWKQAALSNLPPFLKGTKERLMKRLKIRSMSFISKLVN